MQDTLYYGSEVDPKATSEKKNKRKRIKKNSRIKIPK